MLIDHDTCWTCYQKLHNSTEFTLNRFLTKIEFKNTGCWQWVGVKNRHGYGRFWYKGRKIQAHCFSYEFFKGVIPRPLEPDHTCRNRACVNPDHLELVTRSTNNKRGLLGILHAYCKRGHLMDEANTYIDPKGRRNCRACHSLISNTYNKKHKDKLAEISRRYYQNHIEECRAKAREYQKNKNIGGKH